MIYWIGTSIASIWINDIPNVAIFLRLSGDFEVHSWDAQETGFDV